MIDHVSLNVPPQQKRDLRLFCQRKKKSPSFYWLPAATPMVRRPGCFVLVTHAAEMCCMEHKSFLSPSTSKSQVPLAIPDGGCELRGRRAAHCSRQALIGNHLSDTDSHGQYAAKRSSSPTAAQGDSSPIRSCTQAIAVNTKSPRGG